MSFEIKIVDKDGDEIKREHCSRFIPIPVTIRTVEFRGDDKAILTLEYLHGSRVRHDR